MSGADAINGVFEACGALAVGANVAALLRSKRVAGVNPWATALFTSWGLWNLVYYPSLGQWASFAGGCAIVAANTAWLALAIRYRGR